MRRNSTWPSPQTYDGDDIYFSSEGGICVEEKWDRVVKIHVAILEGIVRWRSDPGCRRPGREEDSSGEVPAVPFQVLCRHGF